MKPPQVLIVVISRNQPNPDCIHSLLQQEYEDFSLLTYASKPKLYHPNPMKNKYLNATANRSVARQMALTTHADYFFFIDDDTIVPPSALPEMLSYKLDILGGWYQMRGSDYWCAGRYQDGRFYHFQAPEKGIPAVDMAGLGCLLVSRKVLEEVTFEHGLDQIFNHRDQGIMFGGDALDFAKQAQSKGYKIYMAESVICIHKTEEPNVTYRQHTGSDQDSPNA